MKIVDDGVNDGREGGPDNDADGEDPGVAGVYW